MRLRDAGVGVVSGVCGARRMTGGWWLMAPAPGPEFWPRGAAELCQDQWNESWLLLLPSLPCSVWAAISMEISGGGAGRWEATTTTSTAQPSHHGLSGTRNLCIVVESYVEF